MNNSNLFAAMLPLMLLGGCATTPDLADRGVVDLKVEASDHGRISGVWVTEPREGVMKVSGQVHWDSSWHGRSDAHIDALVVQPSGDSRRYHIPSTRCPTCNVGAHSRDRLNRKEGFSADIDVDPVPGTRIVLSAVLDGAHP